MTTIAATHEHPCNKVVTHCNLLAGRLTATAPASVTMRTHGSEDIKNWSTFSAHAVFLCQMRGCFPTLCQANSRIRWGCCDRGRSKEEADKSSHQCPPPPPETAHSLHCNTIGSLRMNPIFYSKGETYTGNSSLYIALTARFPCIFKSMKLIRCYIF